MVNYQKVDAGLASALAEVADPEAPDLTVFIHTTGTLTPEQLTLLQQYGINDASTQRQIFTATRSARMVRELTQQPWVHYIRLASPLRPLGKTPGHS